MNAQSHLDTIVIKHMAQRMRLWVYVGLKLCSDGLIWFKGGVQGWVHSKHNV